MLSKNLTLQIRGLLEQQPRLRDDDQYLVAMVWRQEIGEAAHSESCFTLLGKIAKHELSHFESIRRIRQMIQEETPELRGEKWQKRQDHTVKVKQEIEEIRPHAGPQENLFDK